MATVLVLAGGNSAERAVSLRSGAAVMAALKQGGHQPSLLDPADNLSDADFMGYDVIFPALHGTGGEDGSLQARLEALGLANVVGSDATCSAHCFDKWQYKQLLNDNQIANPAGTVVTADTLVDHPLLQAPFVLKPYDGGSSVDTFIVRDTAQADMLSLESACQQHGSMLLEELIAGVEITVGVVGNSALPVIEIIPPSGAEFDYENKYNGATQELCPPQNVVPEIQSQAQDLALHIHTLCGCRDMSRTDMIVTANNELYVLETNTIPGLTDQSLLPRAAAQAGMTMPELCDHLVTMAAQRA